MLAIHDEHQFDAIAQIDRMLKKGIRERASDLHFESSEHIFRIRCRKDGLLYEIASFPKKWAESLTTRLKVMGNLDISEHRLPQDGRFYFTTGQGKIDCRISSCPTSQGEKIVVRLLNTTQENLDLEKLGMDIAQQEIFNQAIHQPQGLILVTGPTGSGKTITLYTAIKKIHQPEKNILTIEDPIEIQLPGINQTAIHPKIGLTFSKALRAFLRQDPDIIMIGEIRDEETASIAIRAAQTGHLVFSTLHTNNALESIARLMSLGVSSYNIGNSLSLVISQRLVRKLCNFCKKPSNAYALASYQAVGCEHCYQGYQGRTGIFEILPISGELKNLVADQTKSIIEQYVSQMQICSLEESAMNKVKSGITSYEELRRVILS